MPSQRGRELGKALLQTLALLPLRSPELLPEQALPGSRRRWEQGHGTEAHTALTEHRLAWNRNANGAGLEWGA